jgi:alpha-galactosidase
LESPYDEPRAALDYVSVDRAHAVLFVYQLKAGDSAKVVKPAGLDPRGRYRVHEVNLPASGQSRLAQDGQVVDGASLMRDGLVTTCEKPFDSIVVELGE